jgi:glyoxylase-like metal-dependent hydrolase (beta-lactamase superfamily II)
MTDGTRTLDILRITGGGHSDTFLMVYLPKEKLLIEADAYTPLAPNAKPPATPNANNVNLIENIERQKLAVDRILPLHGRVVPVAELYSTASAKPKQ